MTVRQKAVKGTMWSVFGGALNQIIQMVSFIILGRILNPEDFGLMAYALVFIGVIRLFSDFGLGYALIQKKNPSENDYLSVFWFSLLISILLVILMIVFSGIISDYTNQPDMNIILKIICFIYVSDSLRIVPIAILTKSFSFNKIFSSTVAGTVVYGLIAIPMAYLGYKTYSLVYGFLASSVVVTIMTFIQTGWKPKLFFSFNETKSLLGFGIFQAGSGLFSYINDNIERFFLGKYLGTKELGLYHFSTRISGIPQVIVAQNIGKVVFPAFSEIQTDDEKLKHYYFELIKYLIYLIAPGLIIVASYADVWIPLVFGDKWKEAIIPFRILMVSGIIAAIGSPLGNVYLAKGKSKYTFYMSIILTVVVLLIYPISLNYGFLFLCGGVIIYRIINLSLIIYFCNRVVRAKLSEYWENIKSPLFLLFIIIIVNAVFLIPDFVSSTNKIVFSTITLLFNVSIIFAYLKYFESELFLKAVKLLKEKIRLKSLG